MIPKVIHYCWFGGKTIPKKDRECIQSWKKFCPDYEIKEWNESNYDLTKNKYMAEASAVKKWGFVSDYARLDIIYQYGGFYLDTDVELINSLDSLLENKGYMGFEGKIWINSGIGFGAEPGNSTIKKLRDMYDDKSFYNLDGSLNLTPCPYNITEKLVELGLKRNNAFQHVEELTIYPTDYFAAKDYKTGKITVTDNTISIHHYHASWTSPKQKFLLQIERLVGQKNIERIVVLKNKLRRKG